MSRLSEVLTGRRIMNAERNPDEYLTLTLDNGRKVWVLFSEAEWSIDEQTTTPIPVYTEEEVRDVVIRLTPATLFSYTPNSEKWVDGYKEGYVTALVDLLAHLKAKGDA